MQEATKRVEVVTRHHGFTGRQRVHEVGIAVIDYVEHVRAFTLRCEPARVVEIPVGEPIADARVTMIR
jgi:hypothetical protein